MLDTHDIAILACVATVCFLTIHMKPHDTTRVQTVFRQSAQWYEQSSQDSHPLIALRDSIFACAYLNAAREIATDTEIEQNTGTDVTKFKKKLDDNQLTHMNRVSKMHRKLAMATSQSSLCQWIQG